jgi:predicted aldo/keto reductase-like oxidoreductase
MEPVKGGSLVNLPAKALELMTGGSPASYAIRYTASFENVMMVLSGMSNQEQMEDNISFMKDFQPLTDGEQEIIDQVRTLYQAQHKIPCTACRYCTDGCPAGIPIPEIFACFNDKRRSEGEPDAAYAAFEQNASACVGCGQCETVCPQHLDIRELLAAADKLFA